MKFSFIIPMYNEEEDIKETVKCCLSQKVTDFDFEIILVNDGSTDNTSKICFDLFSSEPLIHIIDGVENMGVSHARNLGVSASKGDVVIFLNADELIESNFLTKIYELYNNNNADYVFPQTRVANINTLYGLYRDCYRLSKYFRPNLFMWSQGFSCRRNLFESVNGFCESYPGCGGEDWDFVSRLDALCKNRVVDTSIIVKHIVPNGFKSVLCHIYNRGRGTAYYDLIYAKKSPIFHILRLVIDALVFCLFIMWDRNVSSVIVLSLICRLITEGWKISKLSNKNKVFIILMHIFNCIIRSLGYNINMLKHINGF